MSETDYTDFIDCTLMQNLLELVKACFSLYASVYRLAIRICFVLPKFKLSAFNFYVHHITSQEQNTAFFFDIHSFCVFETR